MTFSREEYAARLEGVREAMAKAGLDALVVVDPSNMHWLTGYDGWSFYVPQAAVVTGAGEPLLWLRPMDAPGAYLTAWIGHESVLTYSEDLIQNPPRHAFDSLAADLAERGLSAARIGMEMDNYFFSAASFEALKRGLPEARFADATGLVNWRRIVKSPAEIALMRKAGEISAAMHRAVREGLTEGRPKHELVAEVQRAAVLGVPGAFGDYAAIQPIAPSGVEASASHITWNDRPLARGEATYFEISGCHRRYHCPVSRTYHLGEPPAILRRAEDAVIRSLEDAMAAAKPGALCEDVAREVYASLARAGFEKASRTGYSVGLSYPPDWGERTMSLRVGDRTELRENMCLHLMPGLWTPDWGMAITESFVVTARGGERLSGTPQGLFVAP